MQESVKNSTLNFELRRLGKGGTYELEAWVDHPTKAGHRITSVVAMWKSMTLDEVYRAKQECESAVIRQYEEALKELS